MPALAAVVALVAALAWSCQALALTVTIVRPAGASPLANETVLRTRGELLSAALAAEIVEGPAAIEPANAPAVLEHIAEHKDVDGVVALVGATAPSAVEVLALDRRAGRTVNRRLTFDASSAASPQTMAIRSVELLRSSFLELGMLPPEPPAGAAVRAAATVVAPVAEAASRPERFAVEIGALALTGFDGVGLTFVPLVSVDWALASWLVADLSVAGLGTRPAVETALGRADVSEAYGVIGAAYRFRAGARLEPYAGLAAGLLRMSVEGHPNTSYQGRSAQGWSFLLDAGAGAWLRLHGRFYASAAAHVQMAEPYLGVRFADTVVATSGRPNLSLGLTLGAWL